MLVLFCALVWTVICHLRIGKEKKYSFLERFDQTLNNFIHWTSIYQSENEIRKIRTLKTFYEHKASIFTPKFGKFLWRIWKIKSSASNLDLCLLTQLTQVTTMEATKKNHRSSHRRCSVKKGALRNFAKKDSGTGVFLWILRNF